MSSGISDAIRQVLDVERRAEAIVVQSEKEAADRLAVAREEARRIVESARREAGEQAARILHERQAQAESERDAQVGQAVAEEERALESRRPAVAQAADEIVREISRT